MIRAPSPMVEHHRLRPRPRTRGTTPRDAAMLLETAPRLPAGDWDRFSGYGVLGLAFASGHIMALRRVTASSIGLAFTSVWHRNPSGEWTFYTDADAVLTCGRYFGPAGRVVREDGIAVSWHGPASFSVRVHGAGIAWAVHLAPTRGGRALAALRRRLPPGLRQRAGVQRTLAAVAGRVLRLDPLTLAGRAPSGHRFQLDTHEFWAVDASTARCHGRHLGPLVSLRTGVSLGDFSIPAWGVFTTGDACFEPDVAPG